YCLCLHFLSLPAVHFPLTCPPITAICTLSLHDALPIAARSRSRMRSRASRRRPAVPRHARAASRAAVCSRSRTQCIEEAGERREIRTQQLHAACILRHPERSFDRCYEQASDGTRVHILAHAADALTALERRGKRIGPRVERSGQSHAEPLVER